jgi:FAD/FMN-containing dehydrogenase
LAACLDQVSSSACDDALTQSDDEFWLTANAGGYLHTGLFSHWNLTTVSSAYTVRATSEADIQAAVRFADKYNIRLAVKGTGHDWYGRSTAYGALLVWTHPRKNITFLDAFAPTGCNLAAVPAATIQTGVQFQDLYPAALAVGRLVMGGTCDSVGVGGCYLGGCYGTFSKLFGSGASNILEAKVVLADGSLVTTNQCTHPDLFWSLRGGGGGLGGIVTEYTVRTHKSPDFVFVGNGYYQATDTDGFQLLTEMLLNYTKSVMAPPYGGGIGFGPSGSGGYVNMWPKGYEIDPAKWTPLLEPFAALVKSQPTRFSGSMSYSIWNSSSYVPGASLPWLEGHPDREISTALLASASKYLSVRSLQSSREISQMAAHLVKISMQVPPTVDGIYNIDFEKGQAGASDYALSLFATTSQNPVVRDATGLFLIMYNVPSLPTLPPSSTVLRHLWPRLKTYVFRNSSDPLYLICEKGATGDEAQATVCSDQWLNERAPALQAQLSVANATLLRAFPNVDDEGVPLSGSYFHETDYYEPDWPQSHWGRTNYARLYNIKQQYDPKGLFICHHCVGSEDWDATGRCRLKKKEMNVV